MFSAKLTAVLLCASLALSGAAYFTGRAHERDAAQKRTLQTQVETFRRGEELSRELFERETRLRQMQTEIEEAANADPTASRPALGVGSVLRLNAIRRP